MKKLLVVTVVSVVVIMGVVESFDFEESELETEEKVWDLYERWQSHHSVWRSLEDKQKRLEVFKANARYINDFNKMDEPYKLELNKFGDMTNHEFRSKHVKTAFQRRPSPRINGTSFMYQNYENAPDSIDWREKGAVTDVKNQGECMGCWAFSAVVAIEGINFIKTKKLVSLSEQELIDCSKENHGCQGGWMDKAFEFVESVGGITTEENYAYTGKDGECNADKEKSPAAKIDGHEIVPQNSEDALLKAVANQPVSVAIDSSPEDFMFYSKGVYTGKCGTNLDHGVTVVGYGVADDEDDGGKKYWIVKNSWGDGWGEKGYVRLGRGTSDQHGQFRITLEASYPLIKSTLIKDEL